MTGKVVFLGLLLVFVLAGAEGAERKPNCPGKEITACPLNLAPVCGSDGHTYANECTLCVHRQEIRKNILIVKDESC